MTFSDLHDGGVARNLWLGNVVELFCNHSYNRDGHGLPVIFRESLKPKYLNVKTKLSNAQNNCEMIAQYLDCFTPV